MRPTAQRLPAIVALATALAGAVNIASALTPELPARAEALLALAPVAEIELAHSLALPAGVGLLAAAWLLFRRRSRAVRAAVVLLVLAGAVDLLKGLDVEECALSWSVAWALWRCRDAFGVEHDPRPSRTAAVRAALLGLAACGAVAVAPSAGIAIAPLLALAVLAPFFAPATLRAGAAAAGDRRRAAALVRLHGADTLAAFKLRSDVRRRWSADARAFAGYRVRAGTMLLAGDPVGPADSSVALLGEMIDEARRHGLAPAVVGASEALSEAARRHGLRRVYIGDEAIVPTGAMDLAGRASRSLRKAVGRVERHGYAAEIARVADLDAATLAALEDVSARWRAGAPERGFAMAHDRLQDELLPDALVVLARDASGAVRGFLHFVPVFGRTAAAVSLAFMRRDRDTPNGLTDFLVVHAARLLGEAGYEELSLNFATFGRWLRAPSSAVERALARVLRVADRWFQVERLYRFNAKFRPRWQPRYLLYARPIELPRIALATMLAEGQLPEPRLPSRPWWPRLRTAAAE